MVRILPARAISSSYSGRGGHPAPTARTRPRANSRGNGKAEAVSRRAARITGACSGPLAQGPGRRFRCAAPLGDRGGIPAFLRSAPCRQVMPLRRDQPSIAPFPDPLRQQAEADGAPSPSATIYRIRDRRHDPQDRCSPHQAPAHRRL